MLDIHSDWPNVSYMKRTVSLKLTTTPEQSEALADLACTFAAACNLIVPTAVEHRCWNGSPCAIWSTTECGKSSQPLAVRWFAKLSTVWLMDITPSRRTRHQEGRARSSNQI